MNYPPKYKYEDLMKKEWLDAVLDNWYKSEDSTRKSDVILRDDLVEITESLTPKKRTQYWELRTTPEELKKYSSGTYWRFTPIWHQGSSEGFREMKVTKTSVSADGQGWERVTEDHEMDLGTMTREVTREMWNELVASGQYIVYNKQIKAKPLQWNKPFGKESNYALDA